MRTTPSLCIGGKCTELLEDLLHWALKAPKDHNSLNV